MSPTGDADLLVAARSALLDALKALVEQRDALILIGAQAIYLHTGDAPVALAERTKDSDLAVDPPDPAVIDNVLADRIRSSLRGLERQLDLPLQRPYSTLRRPSRRPALRRGATPHRRRRLRRRPEPVAPGAASNPGHIRRPAPGWRTGPVNLPLPRRRAGFVHPSAADPARGPASQVRRRPGQWLVGRQRSQIPAVLPR